MFEKYAIFTRVGKEFRVSCDSDNDALFNIQSHVEEGEFLLMQCLNSSNMGKVNGILKVGNSQAFELSILTIL